ncbi:UNKNOWN [Stylonychia lemnae]|uniref:EF-hand domain-containing protein n=1 Tax=Stylonychia lemnae TaxID=5949 RepID=A0A077ZTR5_STYLE|nr:UNKNOWN [Stylonychia lemnae]|eukprot:CDW71821.1 UNKNOWN [Stylonychia lemnae]
MPKKSQQEETRDEIKAFTTKEDLIQSFIEQTFRVLDMDRAGTFTRDDLIHFLGFFVAECNLMKINEASLDQILIKKVGVKDLFKINSKQLDQTIRIILEEQLNQFNRVL